MTSSVATTVVIGLLAVACTAERVDRTEIPAELEGKVLARVPSTATPTLFDFGGKVALVGFETEPARDVRPGETVSVRLYWRRTGKLSDGWRLFTHLENDAGAIIGNYDMSGPLRRGGQQGGPALAPSRWQRGRVYVDELSVEVPTPDKRPVTDRITLVSGVWRRNMRLEVRSGPAREQAAVVTHFRTGVAPAVPKADDAP